MGRSLREQEAPHEVVGVAEALRFDGRPVSRSELASAPGRDGNQLRHRRRSLGSSALSPVSVTCPTLATGCDGVSFSGPRSWHGRLARASMTACSRFPPLWPPCLALNAAAAVVACIAGGGCASWWPPLVSSSATSAPAWRLA